MPHYTTETFFRPPEYSREAWTLAPQLYNRCQLLLSRSPHGCVFVPIRAMQYLAVIDPEEIVFVDAQGGYVVQGDEGGRIIQLAWTPHAASARASLSEPVGCDIVYFFPGLEAVQARLVGELARGLEQLARRDREGAPLRGARVVPLRPERKTSR